MMIHQIKTRLIRPASDDQLAKLLRSLSTHFHYQRGQFGNETVFDYDDQGPEVESVVHGNSGLSSL